MSEVIVTVEQLEDAAKDLIEVFVPVRRCSICDEPVGYVVQLGALYFDRGCGCTRYHSPLEPRDWSDEIAFIQASEDPGATAKKFGVSPDAPT